MLLFKVSLCCCGNEWSIVEKLIKKEGDFTYYMGGFATNNLYLKRSNPDSNCHGKLTPRNVNSTVTWHGFDKGSDPVSWRVTMVSRRFANRMSYLLLVRKETHACPVTLRGTGGGNFVNSKCRLCYQGTCQETVCIHTCVIVTSNYYWNPGSIVVSLFLYTFCGSCFIPMLSM